MRDLFDDFMDELRRRQEAAARGEQPPDDAPHEPGLDEEPVGPRPVARPRRTSRPGGDGNGPSGGGGGRRPPAGGGRGRGSGGPGGGGGSAGDGDRPGLGATLRVAAPRLLLAVAIILIVLLLTLAGTGVDLWTDAIWYRSVGFDSVFWTRLGTQVLLFLGVALLAIVVLGANVLLAGRLAARHRPEAGGGVGRWRERFA